MSATKRPASPGTKHGHDELLTSLREHLSDEDAQMLADRMKAADRDEESAADWHVIKRRIPHGTPKS